MFKQKLNEPEKVREKVGENLTNNQRLIIKFITAKILSKKLGISDRKIEGNIRKLREASIIKLIRPAKGGHWEVINNSS